MFEEPEAFLLIYFNRYQCGKWNWQAELKFQANQKGR